MAEGTVKWFKDSKGFDFITPAKETEIALCIIRRSRVKASRGLKREAE